MITRTQDEIIARIKEVEPHDFMGTIRGDLLEHLDFEHAKPFLKDDVTETEWAEACSEVKADPRDAMLDYLPFAMSKAAHHRGLSADRSIDHFHTWVWLMGDDDLADAMSTNYSPYGVPILKALADALGDKGREVWAANTTHRLDRMAHGEPCSDDCYSCVG